MPDDLTGCCWPGNAPRNINEKCCTPSPFAPLPGITVLESWMRKRPPKGGLVLCSLCVVAWTVPDPSSAPSVGTGLWHSKHRTLATVTFQSAAVPQRPTSVPWSHAMSSSSQISGTPFPSQQEKWVAILGLFKSVPPFPFPEPPGPQAHSERRTWYSQHLHSQRKHQ